MTTVIAARGEAANLASVVPDAAIVDPSNTAGLVPSPAVIWLDGLSAAEIATLDTLLATRSRVDIAVSSGRLDGLTDPPLVAHCRGLIAGFGHDGLSAAVALLSQARVA